MDFPPPPPPSYTSTIISAEQLPYSSPTSAGRHQAFPTTAASAQQDSDGNVVSEHIDTAKYKTKMCTNYQMGIVCTFGNRCAFAHGPQELRANAPSGPPSYLEFAGGPSTPRSAGAGATYADVPPPPPVMQSPTRCHPRSVPGSPVAQDGGSYPVMRFRNNPYSVDGFDEMAEVQETTKEN